MITKKRKQGYSDSAHTPAAGEEKKRRLLVCTGDPLTVNELESEIKKKRNDGSTPSEKEYFLCSV